MYFTSDTHFNHKNVIGYCNRPYANTFEMDKALIQNWNNTVKKDNEHVYVLGDFAMCGTKYMKEILSQLKGHKILVKGNHDKDAATMFEMGFDKVVENELISMGNQKVLLSHFPYHPIKQHNTWNDKVVLHQMDDHVDNRYLHKRILDDGKTILLHGHVHQAWKTKGERMINVGVDVWDYKPVNHEQLIALINKGLK